MASSLLAGMAAPTPAETGRLFLDLAGNGGDQHAAHPGDLALENPQLPDGGGRLYIYWQFGRPMNSRQVSAINYNITIDGGAIVEAFNYNPEIVQLNQRRWQEFYQHPRPNPPINPGGNGVDFNAITINQGFGLKNDTAAMWYDQGYDVDTNSTILGYVDVVGSNGATVWLTVADGYIYWTNIQPGEGIYIGFGDEFVRLDDPRALGRRTTLPEATIIPEPASAPLLAALCLSTARSGRPARSSTAKGPARTASDRATRGG